MATGLVDLNRGSVNTCVRSQDGSVVDITLASPSLARRIQAWKVVDDVETMSDHRYIRFDVSASLPTPYWSIRGAHQASPRWSLKGLDRDALVEASLVKVAIAEEVDAWWKRLMWKAGVPHLYPILPISYRTYIRYLWVWRESSLIPQNVRSGGLRSSHNYAAHAWRQDANTPDSAEREREDKAQYFNNTNALVTLWSKQSMWCCRIFIYMSL